MKQTPQAALYARLNQTQVGGGGWRTVAPPPPTQPAPRRQSHWGAFIIAVGLVTAAFILVNGGNDNRPARMIQPTPQVTVHRAESAVPRAQPVVWPRAEAAGPATFFNDAWFANPANCGRWFTQEIPGQGKVWIRYQGQIGSTNDLPEHPSLWDEYHTSDGSGWVWMIPAGATTPQWVDP
jgi:hypothetical protein